uniref:Uncharacterized protein n=1 Tax=Euplotes harpa TaxID=151035 RepID=A0A7S3JMH8_9SPIT|mmetsp:Transcript_969/g.931  ORF Transcript_969/g.931 Transcript_969/m.931 type:complete len:115 (+) Transcript_969:275-619(+)
MESMSQMSHSAQLSTHNRNTQIEGIESPSLWDPSVQSIRSKGISNTPMNRDIHRKKELNLKLSLSPGLRKRSTSSNRSISEPLGLSPCVKHGAKLKKTMTKVGQITRKSTMSMK